MKLKRRRFLVKCAAAAATGAVSASAAGQTTSDSNVLEIDCDFPGGNIVVERIEGDRVYLRQDQRDTPGFWFYWYFRVRGAAGRRLTFHFTKGNVLGVRGPAVSSDGGKSWDWLGAERMEGASFTYAFPSEATEVRFCLAIPYLEANLRTFLDRYRDNPHVVVEHHATTKKGRRNERLRLGRLEGEPRYRVLLTCRHHCCEMIPNWLLEGLIDFVLADTPGGRWFCDRVEFLALPFMDKDGVEDGDQGKNRKPYDHNRDYLGESIYPSVAALKEFVPEWSRGRLRMALDLHCPYIRGGGDGPSSNERIFLVGNPSEATWERQQEFGRILREVQTGPLVYDPKHNVRWGQSWNTLKEPRSCSRWAASLDGVRVSTTMETPYANVAGTPVTVDAARALGRDLARAIRKYLET